MDLVGDDFERVGAIRDAAYLHTGHLALELPRVAVDIENSSAEEVAEDGGEGLAFGVVMEAGFQDVFDVVGVARDGVAKHVHVDGSGGGVSEKVSVPVAEVVEVFSPSKGKVCTADFAVAAWLHSEDEDEEGEDGENNGEREEEEAEGGGHGF